MIPEYFTRFVLAVGCTYAVGQDVVKVTSSSIYTVTLADGTKNCVFQRKDGRLIGYPYAVSAVIDALTSYRS
jgi:RAB protein geranylgeranyltransferase component A